MRLLQSAHGKTRETDTFILGKVIVPCCLSRGETAMIPSFDAAVARSTAVALYDRPSVKSLTASVYRNLSLHTLIRFSLHLSHASTVLRRVLLLQISEMALRGSGIGGDL